MPSIPFFEIVRGALRRERLSGDDASRPTPQVESEPRRRLVIVGNPNVGKSVLFNRLTGRYVTVSNYPGTTVEVSRGRATIEGVEWEVVDTPGMYSLRPLSEEERVARGILLHESADVVLHVLDAKNLERMLPLTLQLLEACFTVVVAANMMDEAESLGLSIDVALLVETLGVSVVPTVALSGRGIDNLRKAIHECSDRASRSPLQI